MLARDLKEFLCAFNDHNVEYLVVGAYAVGVHAEPRATKDLDVFIGTSKDNGEAVFRALTDFGAPLTGLSPEDFSDAPNSIFQIGQPPLRVDILQQIEGIDFEEAWKNRVEAVIEGEVSAHVISREHLIKNKLAVGRGQDLVDVEKILAAWRIGDLDATPKQGAS